MVKHSIEANHPTVTLDNFTVLRSGYRNRKFNAFSANAPLLYRIFSNLVRPLISADGHFFEI